MRAQQLEDELVLRIPKAFDIEAGAEFVALRGDNGSITYVPKQKNIFKEAVEKNVSLRTPVDENYDYKD